MEFLIDLVHHNPGEPPFHTKFSDPQRLATLGYSAQVLKHLNCAIRFDTLGRNDFAPNTSSGDWIENLRHQIAEEIKTAKTSGLQVFYHIDLFVLPRIMLQDERDAICNSYGKICLNKPRTLEIHRALFNEMFRDFPQVDGLIIRVGETYLFDTPYHCGNTAVPLHGNGITVESSQRQYVTLLRFLREEICERHGRFLIQRTWDIYNDRFHADPSFYLAVTKEIPPHPKLIFSIKHTALDFFRRVKTNPSLGLGQHPQIIEIQCQREYEGKGAFPNYIGHMIADGFPETREPTGLQELLRLPTVQGVFTWSRGGGWFGPYLKEEFWCRLNVEVISALCRNPLRREQEIFEECCRSLGIEEASIKSFRKACLLSAQALLAGRYCKAYDQQWHEATIPTELWMRDDRLGGMDQLRPVFDYLRRLGKTEAALAEKHEAVRLWEEALSEFESVKIADTALRERILTSFLYAVRLFRIIATGWEILARDYAASCGDDIDSEELRLLYSDYREAWKDYRELESAPGCASLFQGDFWNWPGKSALPGMDASVEAAIDHLEQSTPCKIPVAATEKAWFGVGVDGAH